jgi:hypothetical protein
MHRAFRVAAPFTSLFALFVGCAADSGPGARLTVADSTVQLLSSGSQQTTTPSGLSLTLIASVEPPTVGTTTVQANSFWLDSNVAYVAYNNAGLPVVGAIDVVDLTVPAVPRLISEQSFATQKVNGLAVSHGTLYYTGSSSELGGAILAKIAISPSGALGAPSAPVKLPSYAGTGIAAYGGAYYATSGDTGGLSRFDASLTVSAGATIADARGVAVSPDGKTLGVVSGQPGAVALFDPSGTPTTSYTLGGASIPESKSTIQMGARSILASLGDGGFAVVCAQNGAVVAAQPAVTIAGVPSASTVTNAVAAGAGLVFAADGVAGVYAYQLTHGSLIAGTNCTTDTLTELGYLDLGNFSANMVYFRNGYLFVADGRGGFRLLNVQNALSDPQSDLDFASPGTGLMALDASANHALSLTGNASLSVVSGYVYVNSTSSSALSASGNAKITATASFIAGSDSLSGNASISGALVTAASPLSDPLSWLPAPTTSMLAVAASTAVSVSGNDTRTLEPGVYQNGISLSGNAQVQLKPGVYYISEGGLSLSGNASLTGLGVLIYNASTKTGITLSGNGRVQLTPSSTGTYAGITIYQNRSSSAAVNLSGNGAMDIRGTLYMPHAALTLSGNAQLPTLGSLDVADTISVSGNGSVVVSQ